MECKTLKTQLQSHPTLSVEEYCQYSDLSQFCLCCKHYVRNTKNSVSVNTNLLMYTNTIIIQVSHSIVTTKLCRQYSQHSQSFPLLHANTDKHICLGITELEDSS